LGLPARWRFLTTYLKGWRKKPVSELPTNPTLCSRRPPQRIGRFTSSWSGTKGERCAAYRWLFAAPQSGHFQQATCRPRARDDNLASIATLALPSHKGSCLQRWGIIVWLVMKSGPRGENRPGRADAETGKRHTMNILSWALQVGLHVRQGKPRRPVLWRLAAESLDDPGHARARSLDVIALRAE
jgi:hypothetical protein